MNALLTALQDFHFVRPFWLLGAFPALLLVYLLWKRRAAYGSWDKVISPHLLPHLIQGSQRAQSRTPLILLLVGWLLACIAMAGPTWQKLPQAVQKKIDAQVIVLDLSLSMYATDLAPSRLMRARMKLSDILQRSDEGLTALVVYAGTSHVVTPLTDDSNTILSMVAALSPDIMPIKGSDPIGAVKKALEVFKQGGITEGRILLMTDSVPANFVAELQPVMNDATPLSIMGIGTTDGAPIALPDGTFVKGADGQIVVPRLAIDGLKQAARQLGGRFSTISATDDDINYLLADTRLLGGNEIKDSRREFDVWDEFGPWVVALLLPFAALGYRRGWLGALLLPALTATLLLHHRPAAAFEWQDLWQTPDQQAQALLRQGDAKSAADTFEDSRWKGTSHYRAGNFEAAADTFAGQPDADSQYNLGNALARQQKFDEAIAAYEKSLQQNPDNEDAKFNLELVKKLKEQQQQQNSQNDDNADQQDQKQQQDQQSEQQDQNQEQNQDQQQNQDHQEQQQDQQQQEQNQQQNDQQQKQDEEQQDQKQPQPDEQTPEDEQEQSQPMPQPRPEDLEQTEDQQALEQWLRRIPDDPGGLLRRKFQQETQLRKAPVDGDSTW